MAASDGVNITEARRWAKENGYDVPAKGALKQEIIDAYLNRDADVESTSDEQPAGHVDVAGITDEVTADVVTEDAPVEEPAGDESTSDGDDAELARYRAAWLLPEDMPVADVERLRATRNRVSVQTLENGFIHYQRHAGTDEVQARLAARGFFHGTAHGYANEDTVQAYARFQDSIGLPGTGIPERVSLEALGFDVTE